MNGSPAPASGCGSGGAASTASSHDGHASNYSPPPKALIRQRRGGRSAETGGQDIFIPQGKAKTQQEKHALYAQIRNGKDPRMHVLFDHLQPAIIDKIIDAISETAAPKGTDVILQGTEGDLFYIVKSGAFDIFKNALEVSIDLTAFEIET